MTRERNYLGKNCRYCSNSRTEPSKEGIVFVSDKSKVKKTPILNTLKEWRDFEYSRTQRRTPVLETLDAMIARIEQELVA